MDKEDNGEGQYSDFGSSSSSLEPDVGVLESVEESEVAVAWMGEETVWPLLLVSCLILVFLGPSLLVDSEEEEEVSRQ